MCPQTSGNRFPEKTTLRSVLHYIKSLMAILDYKSAGVDIDEADRIKSRIREIAERTLSETVLHSIGPFAAVVKLPSVCVVATCDGVGTKTALAYDYGKLDGLGFDLVAMNVNDIIAMHGNPIIFLDYIGVPSLYDVDVERIVASIADACREAGCSLVGGETAQMPGFYEKGKFEMVGFCVGIARKTSLPKKEKITKGDVIVAFPSNGIHSNGYSLIRKLIEEKRINPDDKLGDRSVIDILLRPTTIYVRDFQKLTKAFGYPKASANVTGGGLVRNLSRIIPQGLKAVVKKEVLKSMSERFCNGIFSYIGHVVPENEMFRVFNMGAGFAMVYPKKKAETIIRSMEGQVFAIGHIEEAKDSQKVVFS